MSKAEEKISSKATVLHLGMRCGHPGTSEPGVTSANPGPASSETMGQVGATQRQGEISAPPGSGGVILG